MQRLSIKNKDNSIDVAEQLERTKEQFENESQAIQHPSDRIEQIATPKMEIQTDLETLSDIITENAVTDNGENNDVVIITNDDAAKWKSIIQNLTQKLKDMEELQLIQAEKMQKFVKNDAATIKRYECELN